MKAKPAWPRLKLWPDDDAYDRLANVVELARVARVSHVWFAGSLLAFCVCAGCGCWVMCGTQCGEHWYPGI